MNKRANVLVIALIVLALILIVLASYYFISKSQVDTPKYFIAIHNEPYSITNFSQEYSTLKQIIAKADEYDIKLTLMFTAQWADYISSSPQRMADLENWKKSGHEIAAHHHGIYHGAWDGYTGFTKEEALAQRAKMGKTSEVYLGTLEDYISHLKKINQNINSGCLNEEASKKEMPDEIIYATCSGFSNHLAVGERESDGDSISKGINDYVLVGTFEGIERKWLAHNQISSNSKLESVEQKFSSLNSDEVYGVVFHSSEKELPIALSYLEFLHSQDSSAKNSKTITQIIESKILPQETLSSEKVSAFYGDSVQYRSSGNNTSQKFCGDGVCGPLEASGQIPCPIDCG